MFALVLLFALPKRNKHWPIFFLLPFCYLHFLYPARSIGNICFDRDMVCVVLNRTDHFCFKAKLSKWDNDTRLATFKSLCQSIRPSVHPSVHPSVTLSKIDRNRGNRGVTASISSPWLLIYCIYCLQSSSTQLFPIPSVYCFLFVVGP